MKKIICNLALIVLVLTSVNAQDTSFARHIISRLSAPEMYGRGSSYHGDSVAASFLASEMQRIGVLPLQVGYLQHYTYNCYSLEGPLSLSINGQELEPYSQFRVASTFRKNFINQRNEAKYKKQLKDGTWIIGVDKLDTYSPIVGDKYPNPVYIQVLNSALPKKVRKVEAELPIQFQWQYRSQNVVGYVPGTIDSMIVFTAHYDHCGIMGDFVLFPGAHDNASGTAAVLDIARAVVKKKPYYTYVFMLFSGEESGLKGSQYAATHPLIDLSKVKLLCNIDMFCGGDEGLMCFNAKAENTKPYFDRLCQLNAESHVAPEIRPRDNSANSDHWWFSSQCPAIFLLTMGQPYGGYHDPYDKCEACGLSHYADYLTLILRMTDIEY